MRNSDSGTSLQSDNSYKTEEYREYCNMEKDVRVSFQPSVLIHVLHVYVQLGKSSCNCEFQKQYGLHFSKDSCQNLFTAPFIFLYFTYFSASVKFPHLLSLGYYFQSSQCSPSSSHLPLAEENNRGESGPHIYFFVHLFSHRSTAEEAEGREGTETASEAAMMN